MRKKYNTPHRSRVVKTRLSEDEYADFTAPVSYTHLDVYKRQVDGCGDRAVPTDWGTGERRPMRQRFQGGDVYKRQHGNMSHHFGSSVCHALCKYL